MARTLAEHFLLGSSLCLLGLTTSYGAQSVSTAQQPRITVLYDAFGKVPGLDKDWGYSALVEADGKRILASQLLLVASDGPSPRCSPP